MGRWKIGAVTVAVLILAVGLTLHGYGASAGHLVRGGGVRIVFTVLDTITEAPLAECSVNLERAGEGSLHTPTDAEGVAVHVVPYTESGVKVYQFRLSKRDYVLKEVEVPVSDTIRRAEPYAELQVRVQLRSIADIEYKLHIQVSDSLTGRKISGASVSLLQAAPQVLETDGSGLVTFRLRVGEYQFNVQHSDYAPSGVFTYRVEARTNVRYVKLRPVSLDGLSAGRFLGGLVASPNPSDGELRIHGVPDGACSYEVVSTGGSVEQWGESLVEGEGSIRLDVRGLKRGLYLLVIHLGDGSYGCVQFYRE